MYINIVQPAYLWTDWSNPFSNHNLVQLTHKNNTKWKLIHTNMFIKVIDKPKP